MQIMAELSRTDAQKEIFELAAKATTGKPAAAQAFIDLRQKLNVYFDTYGTDEYRAFGRVLLEFISGSDDMGPERNSVFWKLSQFKPTNWPALA